MPAYGKDCKTGCGKRSDKKMAPSAKAEGAVRRKRRRKAYQPMTRFATPTVRKGT